jgi:hypothetical protein
MKLWPTFQKVIMTAPVTSFFLTGVCYGGLESPAGTRTDFYARCFFGCMGHSLIIQTNDGAV